MKKQREGEREIEEGKKEVKEIKWKKMYEVNYILVSTLKLMP